MAKKENPDEFMQTMRKRFELAQDHDSQQRDDANSDIKFAFVPGEQWDPKQKKARRNRACYEFNRLRQSIKQVTGEQRKNRPQIKIRATEDSDKKTAETLQGLVRNIESVSNADHAYDTAFQFAVTGGYGVWRVTTDYCSEMAWDQEIIIKEVRNPFIVYFDPAANEWDRRDGHFAFVGERISIDEFKERWPDADVVSFEMLDDRTRWCDDNTVLICEYWTREPVVRKALLLSDGRTVFEDDSAIVLDELATAGITVIKERMVKTFKVTQHLVSGAHKDLEPPKEWAGKWIPIVPCWGDLINIDGEDKYNGMVRFARDTQKLYNYNRTTSQEFVGKSPKAPYLITGKQIKGYEAQWNSANADDAPYLLYTPDPDAGGKPVREPAPQMPVAMVQLLQLDAEDIKATTGIYDASLGARSNETSGKAILARQNQGDTATFEYTDNLSRAIRFTGEILVDLIPKIYDTQRVIRILGEDDSEEYVTLNQTVMDEQTGQPVVLNDVSKGRYDVTVTVGPSYQTARMELADTLLKVTQANPAVAPILTDLVVKNLDLPGGDEAAKRLRRMAVRQGIVPPNDEDKEDAQENPPPPNPAAELQMRGAQAEVQAKELENAKALKELQQPTAVDQGPAVQAAQLQLEAQRLAFEQQKAQADLQLQMQIEQMKIAQAQWEKQAEIEAEIAKARIDAETRVQIAMLDQQQKAQEAASATEANTLTELARIAQEARTAVTAAREAADRGGMESAMQGLASGLTALMEAQSRPRVMRLERGPDGMLAGGVVQ